MSIQKTDIKLMASERLTDFYDGGGEMTGSEIIDGQVNNLFPDISRMDRVYGRVSLRKAYVAVMTDNVDMYYGSHVIITQPPDDNNVHTTMFTRDDFYDERADAKNRMESYVSIAHELVWRPLNDQLKGQRAITCFANLGNTLPKIGDTIVLKNSNNDDQQYIRITDISSERQTFAMQNYGNFTVDVAIISLSAALQHLFPGIEATPYTTKAATRIHATIVTDASSYYGVSKMAQTANQGDMSLWVDSIYNQLVPTSQIETPLIYQLMGGDNTSLIAKGLSGSLTFSGSRSYITNIIHLSDGVMPGSLQLEVANYHFRDVRGQLVPIADDGGFSGYIDYTSGQTIIENSTNWSATVNITATPAVAVAEAFITREIAIELANRAFNYTPILTGPLPAPGSITVAFMAQGRWYELYDDGNGVLVGTEDGIGTGTIDYASGSMILTVGALPDVGTTIIIQWGHGIEINDRKGAIDGQPMMISHTLPDQGLQPGSIIITWDDDGVTKTATDNSSGVITGDAVGSLSYGAGELLFVPNTLPESGTEYTVSYEQELPGTVVITDISTTDGITEITIPALSDPVRPHSVVLEWEVSRRTDEDEVNDYRRVTIQKQAYDNGNGSIVYEGEYIGSIDYATGVISFTVLALYEYYQYQLVSWTTSSFLVDNHWEYGKILTTSREQSTDRILNITYAQDTVATWLPQTDSIAAPALSLNLCPTTVEPIAAGSIVFTMDGHNYYDDAGGNLYRDKSTTTGVGTLCGTINYATGLAQLTTYPAIANSAITLTSLLTKDGGFTPCEYVFRCPGAPVRDGSLSVQATQPDGTLLTAIAANDGTIVDTSIAGTIDTVNAVVRLHFGALVVAAGNEEEDWYNAAGVDDDGNIWRPQGVIPETALYNCVIYSFLPLDADLLGIEPIRLSIDGRVPIFKSGDVAVIHHTDDELLPDNLTAAQQITLARDRLALCDITDQNGELVAETNYTINLDSGVLTMAEPLDLSAYVQPLVAATRIEDMVLISEAQINGLIRTVGPLTHDYPALETQVSTALTFNDLAARIVRSFTQKTWDNVWSDSRSGADSIAKFDDLHYPLLLTNKGSIAQRWCIKFTGSTTFDVISEKMGILASGNTSSDVAPINPATSEPYFTIDHRGWGTGWSTSNCLRFDTSSANASLWLARTTMQGAVEEPTDEFVIQIRGDAN